MKGSLSVTVLTASLSLLLLPGAMGSALAEFDTTAITAADSEPIAHMSAIKRIVLDPGHGGENTGCMGFNGVFEKYVTIEIAERVKRMLERRTDAKVFITRFGDIPFGLRERTRYANGVNADALLSIHLNAASRGTGHGIETFFLSTKAASDETRALFKHEELTVPIGANSREVDKLEVDAILDDLERRAAHAMSEVLAASIQKSLVAATQAHDRGVKQAPFAVLKEAVMPAVVIECGFLTHPEEGTKLLLEDYQRLVAHGITQGVIAFDRAVSESPDPSEPPPPAPTEPP